VGSSPAGRFTTTSHHARRRRVSRRSLVFAALLVALAILLHFVHVRGAQLYTPATQGGVVYLPTPDRVSCAAYVMLLDRTLFSFDVSTFHVAQAVTHWWEQYERYAWVFAVVAGCIVVRELLPIARLFGQDEEEGE
jgi:hypothetical protein